MGTFHLHFTEGRTLRPADLPLLNSLSQQAAIALRLVTLADEGHQAAIASQREAQARRINDFLVKTVGSISGGVDLPLAVEAVIVELARALDTSHVQLFRHDAETRTIRLLFPIWKVSFAGV